MKPSRARQTWYSSLYGCSSFSLRAGLSGHVLPAGPRRRRPGHAPARQSRSSRNAGIFVRQGGPISGSRVSSGPAAVSPKTRRGERRGPVHADQLGGSARYHRRKTNRGRARVRKRGDSSLQLCGHHGIAERQRNGPPLFPSPGSLAFGPHNLFRGRNGGSHGEPRVPLRYRAGAISPRETHHRVGRQYSRDQCAPVAVPGGSQAQRREAMGDRSHPHAHRRAGRSPSADSSRHATWRWRWA